MIITFILNLFYGLFRAVIGIIVDNTADVTLSSGFGASIAYFGDKLGFINNFIPVFDLSTAIGIIISIEIVVAIYKLINKGQKLLPGRSG